jgi:protein bicaudal C
MKMDVSYTDHSYIIGRGGQNIKRIMDETQTHIHFPDSNRSNPTEKSNQVSLCGSLEGVEKARALVRDSTPLLLSFELPIAFPGEPTYDNNTPFIKEMEKQYGVQVIFSSRPKLHSSMVLVKGCEKEHKNVIDATKRLLEFMFGDQAVSGKKLLIDLKLIFVSFFSINEMLLCTWKLQRRIIPSFWEKILKICAK